MSKITKPVNDRVVDKDRYWSGVFTGVFIGCFFISMLVLLFIRVQGLTVAINPASLARMVQVKVQEEAQKDIPQLLEGFKQELPAEITNNLDGLAELQIGFGKSQIKLPEEAIAAIKTEFSRIMETAIVNTINSYDVKKYEDKIGQDAYDLVHKMLQREIIGKTYLIRSSDWFSVPVKVVGSKNHNLRMGI